LSILPVLPAEERTREENRFGSGSTTQSPGTRAHIRPRICRPNPMLRFPFHFTGG